MTRVSKQLTRHVTSHTVHPVLSGHLFDMRSSFHSTQLEDKQSQINYNDLIVHFYLLAIIWLKIITIKLKLFTIYNVSY